MLLVRHGHAGTKEGWAGDDRLRPLDARGRRQAAAMVGRVLPCDPTRLVSSPYLRCLQTMEPLAAETGLRVEVDDVLTPEAAPRALTLVRALARSASSDGVVLCTHGEVMAEVLNVLATEDGVSLGRRLPGPKGCFWVLEFHGGRALSARYVAPAR
jgi:8-oxo-dGTP diphosphatase